MSSITRAPRQSPAAARGEVLPAGPLLIDLALEVAARQAATGTRRTYASTYRSFARFVDRSGTAGAEQLTAVNVRRYRDHLAAVDRATGRPRAAPTTIAKQLSALRTLAAAIDADASIAMVKAPTTRRARPRSITAAQLERLLRLPDRRTRRGKRDLAVLHLLATEGLRRAEAAALGLHDVEERARASNGALRPAIHGATTWWLLITGKRGRYREIPLAAAALEALTDWVAVRPPCDADTLLVSLPRGGWRPPSTLNEREIGRIVEHYATLAELPEDRRGAHVLRHTFCTQLADRNVPIEVIRDLAGHDDIRTTSLYVGNSDERLEEAIIAGDEEAPLARRARSQSRRRRSAA